MRVAIQYFRDFIVLAALVVLTALMLTVAFYGSIQSPRELVRSCGLIASGPVGGWFLAAADHSIITALWSLLPLTLFTFGPLAMAVRSPVHRVRWLVLAGAVWLLAGILYGVAIWV